MNTKRNNHKSLFAFFAVFFFSITLLSGTCCVSAAAEGTPKTPAEAVSEMRWGVNLGNLYMADKVYNEVGMNTGYSYYAPIGIAAWFWDGSFDWMAYYELHEEYFTARVLLPAYQPLQENFWFDGMFQLGVFIKNYTARNVVIEFQNARIEKADGSTEYLPTVDGIYTASNFGDYNEYDFANCILETEDIPEPSPNYNGATLCIDVRLLDVPFSESGKVDYFFEYQRRPIDQYAYTNAYLDQGANVFRLPVTWSSFVDDQTFVIDSAWIEAIKTEVDYILRQGAYCILNLHDDYLCKSFVLDHWEECWMMDEYKEYVDVRFESIWDQIADNFRDYPDKLIFETANEPTMNWDPSRMSASEFAELQIRRTNELNEIFVNAVRRSGGNNKTRILCLAVANYNAVQQLPYLAVPDDDYILATLHSYQEMEDNSFNSVYDPYFDYVGKINAFFEATDRFTKTTGVPILIGEVGATHRIDDSARADRVAYFFRECEKRNIPALWWEDYFVTDDGYYYWLYDVENKIWSEAESLKAIQEAYSAVPGPSLNTPQVFVKEDSVAQRAPLELTVSYIDPSTEDIDIYAIASDNRTRFSEYEMYGDTILFQTEGMTPGLYRITLICKAKGRMPGYWESYFSVTEMEEAIIQLPEELKVIESGAFSGMQNKTFLIPSGVASIANDSFDISSTVICTSGSYAAIRCGELGLNVLIQDR